jgi:tetraprenyl-beta-curcumene synthase
MPEARRELSCAVILQGWSLSLAVARELVWGLRAVLREVERWRSHAASIPDRVIREEALAALDHKRPNTDGAALLWTIPNRRSRRLLRLLVAYEIMGDFLDSMIERGVEVGCLNGRQLHLALVDAVDLQRPMSDYYLEHPWCEDGGYLNQLVAFCRYGCGLLPAYGCARPVLVEAARLAQVQGLNHEPDLMLRRLVLEAWALSENNGSSELGWYETAGAASAWLTVLAVMAVAAEPLTSEDMPVKVFLAYFPWIALTATLLDSYDDLLDDQCTGAFSYLSVYGSFEHAVMRIEQCVKTAIVEARSLEHGERHVVIVSSMIALYLSKESVYRTDVGKSSATLLRASGPLTLLLAPVLRVWRVANALGDT